MSSNSQISTSFPNTKSTTSSTPAQTPIPPSVSSAGNESQRRNLGSISGGVCPRYILGAPRNGQVGRKSHKNHRKPNTPRDGGEEHIDEYAMTLPTGRKGTSITHLMNWNVASRPQSRHYNYRHNSSRTPTWGIGSGYHAADKARFINANYRFLVHPRGDYRAQAVDSDVHLPWDLVLQVLASEQTQRTNCPICLSTPVAPRMARCGHIFCLPCLLRYMASTDDTTQHQQGPPEKKPRYKKCVICMDSTYSSETRPVRFYVGQENPAPREREDVVLRLVMRRQGSTLALPKESAELMEKLEDVPWHFAADVMDYARVMKGTENYMDEQYTREIKELEEMEQEDELMFGEDSEWTQKAIANIKLQKEVIKGMGNPPKAAVEPPKVKETEKSRPEIIFNENDEDVPAFYHIVHEASSGHSSSAGSRSQSTTPSQQPLEAPKPGKRTSELPASMTQAHSTVFHTHDAPYYFYQALPHYYLHSLDIRILKAAFGSYQSLPSTVLPRVENVATGTSVDDDLRKRTKYVAHLPAGCEVGFIECDWTDIVPSEILDRFHGEIERRRKKKRDKDMKEERDRIRAEKEEEMMQRHKRRESLRGFSEEDFVALATRESPNEVVQLPFTDGGEGPSSAPLGVEPHEEEVTHGTSPSTSRTVWGTPLVLPQGAGAAVVQREETGGWQDWEREFLDDETLGRLEEGGGRRNAPSQGKGGKRFKKVTLMTNGGKRGA